MDADDNQFLRLAASHGTVTLVSHHHANFSGMPALHEWRLVATYRNETRPVTLMNEDVRGNPSICAIVKDAENRRDAR